MATRRSRAHGPRTEARVADARAGKALQWALKRRIDALPADAQRALREIVHPPAPPPPRPRDPHREAVYAAALAHVDAARQGGDTAGTLIALDEAVGDAVPPEPAPPAPEPEPTPPAEPV